MLGMYQVFSDNKRLFFSHPYKHVLLYILCTLFTVTRKVKINISQYIVSLLVLQLTEVK